MDEADEPVRLIEDEETGDRFLVYSTERGPRIDLRYEGDTLWMSQAQISDLFGRDRTSITKHINNILEEGELDSEGCVQKVHKTRSGRPTTLYNLDMVISVGYRVSSAQATVFRRWATNTLVQFAKKGFVVDAQRLKDPSSADRLLELREIIRDIRSDEANVYRELKRICSLCQDYDGSTDAARAFYQKTQAKLVYAVVSATPAEVVATRADSTKPNMGLQTWANENIRKQDVSVSKNFLAAAEIKELNRLTTILLDIFEDQLDLGRLVVMSDAERLLNENLKNLGRGVLRDGGRISAADAKRKAEAEYEKFDEARRLERRQQADRAISSLASEAKKLPRTPR